MTEHLILVSIGPVQAFIAEARRTRDLWFGSHVLSEIAKAAARAIVEETDSLECLVFPAPASRSDLEPMNQPVRDGVAPLNVANKLLVVVPAGLDAKTVAEKARDAASKRWAGFADSVWQKWHVANALAANVSRDTWNAQIESLLEFQAAWTPLDNYKQARDRLEAQLAGRKALRDFEPYSQGIEGAYKSSLDGGRDSVLPRNAADRRRLGPAARNRFQRARIGQGEQLDAVGLVKRDGGDPEQFIPVSRVALADWLDQASKRQPELLRNILDLSEERRKAKAMTRVFRRGSDHWVTPFPFDGHIFMQGRRRALMEESLGEGEFLEDVEPKWAPLFEKADELIKTLGEPDPYVACIVADGDRMGVALDAMNDPEPHRSFSRELAAFAQAARDVVERTCRGMLVYAGGDDVLAFVNVADALRCADALRQAFAETMAKALPNESGSNRPTLSVGIGIGHCLESMGNLLELGRQAEKLAKGSSLPQGQQRNALAILLDKRSGGRIQWRTQWNADPVKRLDVDVASLRHEKLSTKKIYEVRAGLQRMPKPQAVVDAESSRLARLLRRETARIIARSGVGEADDEAPTKGSRRLTPAEVGLELPTGDDYREVYRSIEDWTARLLIAKSLMRREPVAQGAE